MPKKGGVSPVKDQEKPKEEDGASDVVRRGANILAPGIDVSPNGSDTEGGEDLIPVTPPSPSHVEIARKTTGKEEDQCGEGKGPTPKAPIIQCSPRSRRQIRRRYIRAW